MWRRTDWLHSQYHTVRYSWALSEAETSLFSLLFQNFGKRCPASWRLENLSAHPRDWRLPGSWNWSSYQHNKLGFSSKLTNCARQHKEILQPKQHLHILYQRSWASKVIALELVGHCWRAGFNVQRPPALLCFHGQLDAAYPTWRPGFSHVVSETQCQLWWVPTFSNSTEETLLLLSH